MYVPPDFKQAYPDFGPDTADVIVAAYVETRKEDFQNWLKERGIPFDAGAKQWLKKQQRRLNGFKAVYEVFYQES